MKKLKRIKWGNIITLLTLVANAIAFLYFTGKLITCIWTPAQLNWIEFIIFWISPMIASNCFEEIKEEIKKSI